MMPARTAPAPSPTRWPRADPCIRALHHPVNRGIGGGFVTGVAEARGEWLILIPADLALDLADLGKYFEAGAGRGRRRGHPLRPPRLFSPPGGWCRGSTSG